MKITLGIRFGGFILAAAFSAALGFGTSASAQETHSYLIDLDSKTATDIGTLGGTRSYARGINDAGQVVGVYTTAGGALHAFITGHDGMGIRDLGTLGGTGRFDYSWAEGINVAGQVVGYSGTAEGARRAFITGPNGMNMRDLGTLGGPASTGWGINDAGQVVGSSATAGGRSHAFITAPNGVGMRDLGTLDATGTGSSDAHGINEAGQVVGFYEPNTGFYSSHAFITGPNGVGMRELGTLGGDATAVRINDAGQVVGNAGGSLLSDRPAHAFITGPDGTAMRYLGTLGGDFSWASGINDAGQVVGQSFIGDACFDCGQRPLSHAFITGPNGAGMIDLNSLVDLPAGVILTEATGINNAGQVIAIGVVPEPEVFVLLLAGLVLIGFIGRRKKMMQGRFAWDSFSVKQFHLL